MYERPRLIVVLKMYNYCSCHIENLVINKFYVFLALITHYELIVVLILYQFIAVLFIFEIKTNLNSNLIVSFN